MLKNVCFVTFIFVQAALVLDHSVAAADNRVFFVIHLHVGGALRGPPGGGDCCGGDGVVDGGWLAMHSEDVDEAGSSVDKDIRLPSGRTLRRNTVFSPVLSMLIVSETMASDGVSEIQARMRASRSSMGRVRSR